MGGLSDFLYRAANSVRNCYYRLKVEKIGRDAYIKDAVFINGRKARHKGIIIGKNCIIKQGTVLVTDKDMPQSGIVMKNRSGFNMNCYVGAEGGLELGQCSQVGPQCCIMTTNHSFRNAGQPIIDQAIIYRKVVIEDNVWVGANSTILAGITIGKGSIIGANSLVIRDIPPNSIARGVPARVIAKRS